MNRLEMIYTIALDYADEFFNDECYKVIESKSTKDFNSLVNKVQTKMVEDGKLTADDICNNDMFLVRHHIIKGVNDALYIRQVCKDIK